MALKAAQKELLNLLADGQFHSGRELSAQLDLSRTAIWNHINELKKLGLELHSVTGKGYRLSQQLELLDSDLIHSHLEPTVSKQLSSLDIHDSIDSTNGQLSKAIHLGAGSGTVCLAEKQTSGRGRLGREWVSPYGRNIYLSSLWHYEAGPAALSGLSLAVGVAAIRALTQEGFSGIGLKWPNDIFSNGKKLGGILIEIMGDTLGPCTVIVGIGLNVDLPEESAERIDQPWTDLTKVMGRGTVSRNRVTARILNELFPILDNFDQTGLAEYHEEWSRMDCMTEKKATLRIGKELLFGTALGIDESGLLMFEDELGQRKAYASGEVSLRAADGN
jgi:BirA family biotin operon repressor/biotin-[acetyl-CoA-carboxylase] ligase